MYNFVAVYPDYIVGGKQDYPRKIAKVNVTFSHRFANSLNISGNNLWRLYSGGSRGGAWGAFPLLFLDQTNFFGDRAPPYPRVWMTRPPLISIIALPSLLTGLVTVQLSVACEWVGGGESAFCVLSPFCHILSL